jgi:hypothetical protein
MQDITCRSCRITKPETEFNKMTKAKTGRQGECQVCARRRIKEWYKSLSPEEKLRKSEYRNEHRRQNPEMYNWHTIKTKYRLTKEAWLDLLASQGGVCAICEAATPGGPWNRWTVDHDHLCCPGVKSCGSCVRGLLCSMCNHGLGNFHDSPRSLQRAVKYLERSS